MIEELKEKIIEQIDPDLFVELLNISTEELCEAFHDRIEENRGVFEDLEEDEDDA